MGKYVHYNRETAKIGFCISLKSVIYFRFVPETIAVETTKISERHAKFGENVKNFGRNSSTTDLWTDIHTHRQTETKVIR